MGMLLWLVDDFVVLTFSAEIIYEISSRFESLAKVETQSNNAAFFQHSHRTTAAAFLEGPVAEKSGSSKIVFNSLLEEDNIF